ncbi:MAG TPA: translation initiation factor IF-2 [Bryobacteraceae bacterium]|nr:translation initiation factor IF-2 [Bryobacteraceae bacterium]
MSKIRINELARQLEIPSHEILEMLPELGVSEKKTHSSSIDEDVAEKIRRRTQGGGEESAPARTFSTAAAVAEPEPDLQPEMPAEPPAPVVHAPAHIEELPEAMPEDATPVVEDLPRSKPAPLRPPLAAGGGAPVHPPLRTTPLPARPAPPAPRPGQILSGPRQPLPPSTASPMPPASITLPAQPAARAAAPVETATPAAPTPGTPIRPQPRAPLAGQPAARPVVPPRPDMVARLQQQQVRPGAAAAPPAPRPGMPTRSSTPVPGQPIYRGPIRPGQPVMRGPGVGAPGGGAAPGGFRRPRTLHPTSPLRAEPATPLPTEQQRRHQAKPGSRDRHRDQEQEEGRLRMPTRRNEAAAPPPIDREITISEGVTVKELSEKLGIKANLVIKKLVEKKIFATINQNLDAKMAEEIARDFGASTNKVSFEEESSQVIEQAEESTDRVKRAPVVTIMGHVDHGKTSLLDAIRSANVAEREAGGITQHIGAYYVEKNGRKIVFIDTPGHEAFTRMRARGAKVTDIVVLVVAADDGVMPQTLEAIDHAKAAGVPIVVAINKVDKPDAQPERIKQQLSDRGLVPEDWGGETVMVPVSAKTKVGLDLLLEMILLVADMQDLKANPDRPAVGNVLEANLDRGRGPVATVLVRNGMLHVGDYFICGSVFGKVRAMFDDRGQPLRDAEPSMPVEVLGLESLPDVGDTFQVVTDTAKAKQIVLYREAKARDVAMAKTGRVTLEQLHEQLKEGEVKELNIILKTDVSGTAEVLSDMMQKLSNDKVRIRVLRSAVGAINESDVLLASTSNAIIVGFNVRPERNAAALAEQEKVDVRLHTIIYELTDELKRAMTGMLEPVFKEVYQGRAEIREVFRITKVGNVAGCMVVDGFIKRDSDVRILRDNVVVFTGKVESLKRFKNDASEVKTGFECGITIRNFGDIKPGDIIEAFATERVAAEVMA